MQDRSPGLDHVVLVSGSEIERPDQGYQRTTLLDRDALEDLLATDDIRARVLDPLD